MRHRFSVCRVRVVLLGAAALLGALAFVGACGSEPSTSPDGGAADGTPATSCATSGDGLTNCGDANESCCTSPLVQGGTFSRDFDGVYYTDPKLTATVSDFRLDKYEVTVGRFRKFVDAVVGGWTPAAGSGKHAHLNGGSGLAASAGGFEPGWDTAWNANLPSSKATWESSSFLACSSAGADSGPTNGAWTSAAAANEKRPINCVNWYQASAFCIWDGGFLPSETEWTYAAAGGNEHRVYPWSRPPTSGKIDSSLATFCNSSMCPDPQRKTDTGPVGSKAAGNGRYGQADLAGNVWEWAVDSIANPRNTSCTDCAELGASSDRVIRGGSVVDAIPFLQVSLRYAKAPTARSYYFGARCARRP